MCDSSAVQLLQLTSVCVCACVCVCVCVCVHTGSAAPASLLVFDNYQKTSWRDIFPSPLMEVREHGREKVMDRQKKRAQGEKNALQLLCVFFFCLLLQIKGFKRYSQLLLIWLSTGHVQVYFSRDLRTKPCSKYDESRNRYMPHLTCFSNLVTWTPKWKARLYTMHIGQWGQPAKMHWSPE